MVTFDDGFEDNYSVVFPILKQLDVPATIFISSDYIGKTETFWFDWVVYLLKKAAPGVLNLPAIPLDLCIENSFDSRMSAVDILLGALKQVSNEARLQTIVDLEQQVGAHKPEKGFEESYPMTWQQVKEMSEWGVEFGSHSASHPILSQLDDKELWHEIADSREVIVEKTGQACDVIAYPVGGACTYDQRVLDMVERSGYRLGTSYRSGVNVLDELEPYALRRIHVELETSRELFAATLALPSLFITKYTLTKL
ncbi:MAG: polysaccharide deacetylase family protein [Gammaproteobacteria bacterium]|nr:polysaccharide deacetylase family protein [Gammaproteobacteria bacterium]